MSSLQDVKKDCLASSAISRIKSRGSTRGELEGDCDVCRLSLWPGSGGRGRTVRRVLAACLLSLAALLGAVAADFGANAAAWRAAEAALGELTSCRTNATLGLVLEVQAARSACRAGDGDGGAQAECASPLERVRRLCSEADGASCRAELRRCCAELEALPASDFRLDANGTSKFSLVILKILDMWGNPDMDTRLLKLYPSWADVLSLRLLVTFHELNLQLVAGEWEGNVTCFTPRWWATVSGLAVAKVMSESLEKCWEENMDMEPNSLLLADVSTFLYGPGSGGPAGAIEDLHFTQECLLATASGSLRLKSRDLLSSMSLKICLLSLACLIYPIVLFSFKQMTEWIQNYALSLRERTEDLKRERRLAEDLLHQMLPKSVAKQLRQQKHVEAESYDKVTIFFSDIVGFTVISASCTPLQVVEMLNNLYMCFDTRIDSYDVYKVETIGDAYMVVSGLPERNGEKHADEIAKMSLDLVAAVRQVPIPHMPNKRLQLRAGIHTGPCVAGIVGYKMPRYCLFGDTVNTASRMESTSLPQKIHTSSDAYLALMKDNAYELQLRGEIEVKGKGKMNTYWLIGHKNYSVQNDSLVCHWNPSLSRKKKTPVGSSVSVANSCITMQSVQNAAGSCGTLGSMVGCLQGADNRENSPGLARGKSDLLPGSVQH
ncbi:uncharacterized protein LOC114798233 isoform X2 [Denticeps clupeoides]|uniref:uncharacterized protein LOC114798233 isoform X2 n=1 Tax=Denticeps clupeoides TaxID=299321 RepID=UPI0010A3AE4E|nr:uncharacterized protein LOC114798233 isoform X2 [Denticeps clupeoides]